MRRTLLGSTILSVLLAAGALPAFADISVAGGGFASSSPSQSGGAVMVSSGASIPALPVEFQGTVFVPVVKQGGYALTAEVRGFTGGGYGGAYVGGGLGVGDMSSDGSSGTVVTVFGGKSIAPHVSIEIRLEKQTNATGATAGFLGLRFSL